MFLAEFEYIASLIDNNYIYIDLPYYSNIGDSLIWKGTEDFLSALPYQCLLRSSCKTYQFPKLSKDIIILMQGGGNWGDLYYIHNEFRKNIVAKYPENRIIILPQTVYYEYGGNARKDAKVFRKHKHLTICARDRYSYRFLKAFGFNDNILLVPDMAFCINTENLKQYVKPLLHKNLYFKRIDKERADVDNVTKYWGSCDISDWPNYDTPEPQVNHLNGLISDAKFDEADRYAVDVYMPSRIVTGVEMISQYDKVFSNRLHGAILSILLDKEVFILDNSYGKNSQYYNTWLKSYRNIHLLSKHRSHSLKRMVKFVANWVISVSDRLNG